MEIIIGPKDFDDELYLQGKGLDEPLMGFKITIALVEAKFHYSD